MPAFNGIKRAYARERLAVTSGAVKLLSASVYGPGTPVGWNQNGAKQRQAVTARVVLDSGSGDIHWTEEGTDPTTGVTVADVGNIAGARDVIYLDSDETMSRFKAIALTATNGIIEVTYYK